MCGRLISKVVVLGYLKKGMEGLKFNILGEIIIVIIMNKIYYPTNISSYLQVKTKFNIMHANLTVNKHGYSSNSPSGSRELADPIPQIFRIQFRTFVDLT